MKTGLKKALAAVLAVVLAASLCGCDRGYIMTVDGLEIKNGIYLNYLQEAYYQADSELESQNSDTTSEAETSSSEDETSVSDETSDETTSTESVPVTNEEIDGKTGSQWIKDETMKYVRRFVAVKRKCEEFNITLTEEEQNEINSNIKDMWDNENQYVQYIYGFKTMGEYFEDQGIGRESMRDINTTDELKTKLFQYYYGEGGELAVSDEDFEKYLTENYVSVRKIEMDYTDASGNALESDEDKKALKDEAQKYADRINNGEKAVDVFYDYYVDKATKTITAKAETDYKEDNEEGLTKEEWIQQKIEEEGIVKSENDEDIEEVINKSESNYDENTTDYIFGLAADGKANVYEGDDKLYVIIKADITKSSNWIESNRDSVLQAMKGDEFDAKLDEFGDAYEVNAQQRLVDKKYGPERLNKKDNDSAQ